MNPIGSHTKIVGRYVGRLGYLCFDHESGQVLALTAAQLLRPSILSHKTLGGQIKLATMSVQTGVPPLEENGAKNVVELLGFAALSPQHSLISVDLGEDVAWSEFEVNRSPHGTLGRLVRLKVGESVYQEAVVKSTNASFKMPHPHGTGKQELTLFSGAIQLKNSGAGRLTRRGDAGTLVLDGEDRALAVIVAGHGEISFAAPLAHVNFELVKVGELTPDLVDRIRAIEVPEPEFSNQSVVLNKKKANELVKKALNAAENGDEELALRFSKGIAEMLVP